MLKQFASYCVVGGMNTAFGLLVILALMELAHVGYVAANAIGYVTGFVCSFALNRRTTFSNSHTRSWRVQMGYFFIVSLVAYLAQLALVMFLVRQCGIDARFGQATGIVLYVVVGFMGNRYLTFAPSEQAAAPSEFTKSYTGKKQ